MVVKKEHPLKGRKKSAASIEKMKATLAAKRAAREAAQKNGLIVAKPERKKYTKRQVQPDTRTFEQLKRDVKEAQWCLEKSVAGKRRAIATGAASLTDVTDEETFLYMAIRYLQGGLR
jgi:hypothetical protein